ncbi:MAG: VanW family protein [Anaerolineales bacterium]|nr:VanW family protein [Anaerolineales bacterium]
MSADTNILPPRLVLPLRILVFITGSILVFGFVSLGFVTGVQVIYDGYIYPGVSVGGVDVSEITPQEAVTRLTSALDFSDRGKIVFRDGENIWVAAPKDVGFFLDAEHNIQKAYDVGRRGTLWQRLSDQYQAWRMGVNLTPDFVFSEPVAHIYLERIAQDIEIPTIEASLKVDGINVIAVQGQVGRYLDIPGTVSLLSHQLGTLQDGEVPLVIVEKPPEIMDVSKQAEVAKRILSESLTLKIPGASEGDPGPWVFERERLAQMLAIERVMDGDKPVYEVRVGTEALRSFLESIAPDFDKEPKNERFIFNDDTGELELIKPATIGQELDIDASIEEIQKDLTEGKHTINLDMEYTNPEVTDDATAESLGIKELVSAHTSYFYGSSAARIQNIATASARFHGYLVAPGETFSMAEVLGDVSLDTGYEEAWIIFGDRTIKGVGGGVCQVSTTLFRTVFFGGYPIVERHPHAYRVYYYEQTPSGGVDTRLAGLDATVYVPLVDLKFKNDTSNWLLMETYVNAAARTLTWKFYSTSDGRTVEWSTTGLMNKKDPPDPLYTENPDLDKGEIKQVDWAVEGADVTVTRTVYRDGEVLYKDTFTTHYMPWRAVCEYGPGTKGMPPEDPDPDNPCKPDTTKKKKNN